jgi:hypothetical protein
MLRSSDLSSHSLSSFSVSGDVREMAANLNQIQVTVAKKDEV